jgi:hypothetical protein
MALPRIRFIGSQTFRLDDGNEVFVTNKYVILSGPREWLDPIGLASLAKAMRDDDDTASNRLYISTDSPAKFDDRYPQHLLDVYLERSAREKYIGVAFLVERDVDEPDAAVTKELSTLLAPLVDRHSGDHFTAERHMDWPDQVVVRFELPTRGKSIGDALAIGAEAEALVHAAGGGALTLRSVVDLVRAGRGTALIGQPEGEWFDGKGAPYRLSTEEEKWELAKDVAAFANSESGGLIFIGAKTRRLHDGDVVRSLSDFELDLAKPPQYRSNLAAKLHPAIEGLEIRTVPTTGTRGMAYIYIPPQRAELKPFVVKGVVVSGKARLMHVSIPVRDGEGTRYASPSEVHSLLQAGRVALQQSASSKPTGPAPNEPADEGGDGVPSESRLPR